MSFSEPTKSFSEPMNFLAQISWLLNESGIQESRKWVHHADLCAFENRKWENSLQVCYAPVAFSNASLKNSFIVVANSRVRSRTRRNLRGGVQTQNNRRDAFKASGSQWGHRTCASCVSARRFRSNIHWRRRLCQRAIYAWSSVGNLCERQLGWNISRENTSSQRSLFEPAIWAWKTFVIITSEDSEIIQKKVKTRTKRSRQNFVRAVKIT